MRWLKACIKVILIIISFFFLSTFFLFFDEKLTFSFHHYIKGFPLLLNQLIHLDKVTFNTTNSTIPHAFLPFIVKPLLNSMTILFLSLFISVVMSLLCIILAKLNSFFNHIMKKLVKLLGYLPDIFYIPYMIIFVIFIFKFTGVLVMEVASSAEVEAILFPSLMLSVVPFVQMYKLLDQMIDEEKDKSYVQLAKAKGLTEREVLLRHIMRNVWIVFFINFRQIVWMTLSSLLIMEVVLNYYGATQFLYYYHQPVMFFVTVVAMFLPIYLLFIIVQLIVERVTGVKL